MSILSNSIIDNLKRNLNNQNNYLKLVESLPKGKVVVRKRRDREYFYLEYRENKRVIYKYLGTTLNYNTDELNKKIKERDVYTERIKTLRIEEKEIRKVLKSLGVKVEF